MASKWFILAFPLSAGSSYVKTRILTIIALLIEKNYKGASPLSTPLPFRYKD
jgi:hypothetical protein